MGISSIQFFSEDISYTLPQKALVRNWIKEVILLEHQKLKQLNFIFCSDAYLLSINKQYLKHNTLTDIVTFDNSDLKDTLAGDIFISIDRVRENSLAFNVTEKDELHRVLIHGVLHLLGYRDKTKEEKSLMTLKEDYYLAIRKSVLNASAPR